MKLKILYKNLMLVSEIALFVIKKSLFKFMCLLIGRFIVEIVKINK